MKYLTEEFLQQYEDKNPKWGPIGELIYLRTYSRWKDDKQRREYWHETLARTVEWSMSLHQGANGFLAEEAKELFDLWYNLDAFPAGRSLWVGGTDYSKGRGFGQFNCSFLDVRSSKDMAELTYLLMSGAGVGFRVTPDNIEILNETSKLLAKKPKLEIQTYDYVGTPGEVEETFLKVDGDEAFLVVGDSREGWSEAIQKFIDVFAGKFGNVTKISVNLDYVRPLGTRLATFGGKASGPEPLIDFFRDSHKVLFADPRGWTSVKALDICNMIGRTVVAGGSRRSAQIALGSATDREFIEAKTGNWFETAPWRRQSNNTVIFTKKPSKEELEHIFAHIMEYGEPGFLNEEEAKRRRPNFRGINPCAEILLDSNGLCNLTTINLMNFIRGKTQIDWNKLEKAIRLQARHNLRVTNVELELHNWNDVQQRDRLIGMSFTGFGDMVDATGMSERNQRKLLKWFQETARYEANDYATQMGVTEPLLVTTIKPEGTITQLPGVSSGLHPNFGPFFLRRVRISKTDAVSETLIQQGFHCEEDEQDSSSWVFSFPIKTVATKYSYDYKAIELLERYKLVMDNYVEHNASITVYLNKKEVNGVVDWLLENWNSYVAVSFLHKSDSSYPQMPYERITEAKYNRYIKTMPKFDRQVLEIIENGGMQATEDFEACSTGACPIR